MHSGETNTTFQGQEDLIGESSSSVKEHFNQPMASSILKIQDFTVYINNSPNHKETSLVTSYSSFPFKGKNIKRNHSIKEEEVDALKGVNVNKVIYICKLRTEFETIFMPFRSGKIPNFYYVQDDVINQSEGSNSNENKVSTIARESSKDFHNALVLESEIKPTNNVLGKYDLDILNAVVTCDTTSCNTSEIEIIPFHGDETDNSLSLVEQLVLNNSSKNIEIFIFNSDGTGFSVYKLEDDSSRALGNLSELTKKDIEQPNQIDRSVNRINAHNNRVANNINNFFPVKVVPDFTKFAQKDVFIDFNLSQSTLKDKEKNFSKGNFCKTPEANRNFSKVKTGYFSEFNENNTSYMFDLATVSSIIKTVQSHLRNNSASDSFKRDEVLNYIPGLSGSDQFDYFLPKPNLVSVNVLQVDTPKIDTPNQIRLEPNPTANIVRIIPDRAEQATTYVDISPLFTIDNKIDANANSEYILVGDSDVNHGSGATKQNIPSLSEHVTTKTKFNCDQKKALVNPIIVHTKPAETSNSMNVSSSNPTILSNGYKSDFTCNINGTSLYDNNAELATLDGKSIGQVSTNDFNDNTSLQNVSFLCNDVQSQILGSPQNDASEKSLYDTVTVLKAEPIIENDVLPAQNGSKLNNINNLDNAIFVFQNNIDPPPKVLNSSLRTETTIPVNESKPSLVTNKEPTKVSSPNTVIIPNNNLNSACTSDMKMPVTNIKIISPQDQSKNLSKDIVYDLNANPQIIQERGKPVQTNQSKLAHNLVQLKYVTLPKITTTNPSANSAILQYPTPKYVVATDSLLNKNAKIMDKKKVTAPESGVGDTFNAKLRYLVKDKNVYKLVYVSTSPNEPPQNVQIINNPNTILHKFVNKPNPQTPMKSTPVFEVKKSSSDQVHVDHKVISESCLIPKLSNEKIAVLNFKMEPHPNVSKTATVLESANLKTVEGLIDINSKKLTKDNEDSLSSAGDSSQSQSPVINSTTMEQVREFESILEKVTKTSQLKEKVPQDVPFIEKDQSSPKKVKTVALGNILLQPTKIMSPASFVLAPDKNVTHVELNKVPVTKSKQTKQSSTKSEDKACSTSSFIVPTTTTAATTGTGTVPASSGTSNFVQKPQEDEQTAEKIYKILNLYTEKIKKAPELKNKLAPRRRSNLSNTNYLKCKKINKPDEKCVTEQRPVTVPISNTITLTSPVPKKTSTEFYPKVIQQTKDGITCTPIQIHQITMPFENQANQVVFFNNNKHIIMKKIQPISSNMTPGTPTIFNPGAPLVHYKIQNNTLHNRNIINYISSMNIVPQTTPFKFAQETQTYFTMENDCRPSNLKKEDNPKELKDKVKEDQAITNKENRVDPPFLNVDLNKHYFTNVDYLFFTSIIFLDYPSSQIFMLETIHTMNRVIQTDPDAGSFLTKYFKTDPKNFERIEEKLYNLKDTRVCSDIRLTKKGPHLGCVNINVEKVDCELLTEHILNFFRDDKVKVDKCTETVCTQSKCTETKGNDTIKVNKCSNNPKCYANRNANHPRKPFKVPQPIDPIIIIKTKVGQRETINKIDTSQASRKLNWNRKRKYCEISSLDLDSIEVESGMPEKKKSVVQRTKANNGNNTNSTAKKKTVTQKKTKKARAISKASPTQQASHSDVSNGFQTNHQKTSRQAIIQYHQNLNKQKQLNNIPSTSKQVIVNGTSPVSNSHTPSKNVSISQSNVASNKKKTKKRTLPTRKNKNVKIRKLS